ncbi:MAG: NAD(P)/FAD-dependent oxidoreductase [bacterium]|nr:NAD(P)/FAD-dependent oxidoreductase [bacterium]
MLHSDVIIVGGGPAGASCAGKLRQQGVECIILDKCGFPRLKLCAGWIPPGVLADLEITPAEYPHTLKHLERIRIYLGTGEFSVQSNQYSIRRVEFDEWLLRRSGIPVHTHEVKQIHREGETYLLDDRYSCDYLVGAGGSSCPVYRILFKPSHPRAKKRQVVTLEQECPYAVQDGVCHLWFFQNRLPGYAWYVPKSDSYVNVGIGGFVDILKGRESSIRHHWQWFTQELERRALVKNYQFDPGGYSYFTRGRRDAVQQDRAFLIGDAAGLATRDLAEGIGPAVKSGVLAAEAIVSGKPLSLKSVNKYSLFNYRALLNFLFSRTTA